MAKKYDIEKAKREIKNSECYIHYQWYRVLNAMECTNVSYADVARFLNVTEEKLIKMIRSTTETISHYEAVEAERFCSREYNSRITAPCFYIDLSMNVCVCSECGEELYIDANGKYKYCPYCGVKFNREETKCD